MTIHYFLNTAFFKLMEYRNAGHQNGGRGCAPPLVPDVSEKRQASFSANILLLRGTKRLAASGRRRRIRQK
jgi:hypothetical protein